MRVVNIYSNHESIDQTAHPEITDFNTVRTIWANNLWPGRSSEIRATSSFQLDCSYDMSLHDQRAVFFRLMQSPDITVGVISGFSTGAGYFRSRGLFVFEEFRRQGYAQILLHQVVSHAASLGHHSVWSVPRLSAWSAYRHFGFELASDWFEEKMEFGPNAVAIYKIDSTLS